jgi:hypothetical protein
MLAIHRRSRRVRYVALAACVCAAPYQVGGGYDYYSGPANQITRSALAIGTVGIGPAGSATLAILRYDDSLAGEGMGFVGGAGLPMQPFSTFQVCGYRYIGDDTFRGWRVKAGPQFSIPGGSSLGIYYSHYEDNNDGRSNGGIAELNAPLAPRLTGRVNLALASAPGELRSSEVELGMTWLAARSVELSGDVGLANNGALTSAPILSGSSSTAESSTESTYQVGVRVMFP